MKKSVSIIIVNYRSEMELLNCIRSIFQEKQKYSIEIIVVDNEKSDSFKKKLQQLFPLVYYVRSSSNMGYGAACNAGASKAKGRFLFFLNPDTYLERNCIDELCEFLEIKKEAVAVSPLLHPIKGAPYQQGTRNLGPIEGIFALSFLNKLFPNNPISRKYFYTGWNMMTIKEVDVLPGTAILIHKKIFEAIGGFDERLFLFFEEFDLCRRIRKKGYRLFINPKAKLKHAWGTSTSKATFNVKKEFEKSRWRYFRKHYGILPALIVELFTRASKVNVLLISVVVFGLFLRTYKPNELMTFIGDQGWFYLSARDLILYHKIPLVGITSSHTWLHQGPLWTYMLALMLFLFRFNPMGGVVLTITIDLLTIFLMYKTGQEMFSKKVGIIAALLYATSPAAVFLARMPYHTSPIPFLSLLYFFLLYGWIKRNKSLYFSSAILCLAILYNLELATLILAFPLVFLVVYGMKKHTVWIKKVLQKKVVIFSVVAFFIPMIPILIYDFNHHFVQTIGFTGYVLYKISSFLLFSHKNSSWLISDLTFLGSYTQKTLYIRNSLIAYVLFLVSIGWIGYKTIIGTNHKTSYTLLSSITLIMVLGLFINKSISDAYMPMVIPFMVLAVAVFMGSIIQYKRYTYFVLGIILFIATLNSFDLYRIYVTSIREKRTLSYKRRIEAAQEIVKESKGRKFNLLGTGPGSEFESFSMNYEYLTWWLGNPPSKNKQELQFILSEYDNDIQVKKVELHK